MVQIKWKESLLTAVLCGGVAWAQQPPMTPPAGAGDSSILTLKEAGKPDQRCRILKTHRTADGKTEYQIQDLATGEIATMVENGPPTLNTSPAPAPLAPMSSSPPRDQLAPVPATTASSHGWFSRLKPLPESPVVPMHTETGRLQSPSELAAGTQELPESQPAPGLLQRVRRFFKRGDAEEMPSTGPSAGFLGSAPSAPLPAMPRVSAPMNVSESPVTGTLTPAPIPPAFRTPAPVPAPALKGQGAAMPSQVPEWKAAMSSPYSNLEPVRLSGPQTLQMARFSQQVASLSRREVLAILRDSPYPSQREVAVESLASADWHTDPNVIPVLIETATEDAAGTVRAACVRCLVTMGANTGPVLQTLQRLQGDPDIRVRREVQAACVAFSGQEGMAAGATVVPAGLK
jgi:hypothetical protein